MVTKAIRAATRIQVGKESTRGTGVAATRRIVTKDASFAINEAQEDFEGEIHGVYSRSVVAPAPTRYGSVLQINTDLDFEQILLPLLSGVEGGVTPTQPGSGDARLWTFTPSATADPAPDTYTVEWAERNMAASPAEDSYEATYGFTTEFQVEGGEEGVPQLSYTMNARRATSSSSTGSVALPTRTHAGNLRWSVYVDDTWAGLGTTKISGQVYGFTARFGDFLAPEYFLDGRSDLDFLEYNAMAGRVLDLSLNVAIDPSGGAFVPSELADKAAQNRRFVRLELVGAAFAAPDAGLNYTIDIDGCFFHAADSMQDRGEERNGVSTVTLHLLSTYDPTSANDVQFLVQNALTAFP